MDGDRLIDGQMGGWMNGKMEERKEEYILSICKVPCLLLYDSSCVSFLDSHKILLLSSVH